MPVFEEKARSPFGKSLLELEIASDLSSKEPVIIRILRTLRQEGCLNAPDSERVQLCLDEAIKNAILHGNRFQAEKKVRFRLFADEAKWGLVIEDEGEGMKPELVPAPTDKDFRESGYGITLLDSIMDEVVYMGRGNQLLLVRRRSEPAEAGKGAAGAVAQVSAMSDEEMEQAQYVTRAAETEAPAALEFDLGDLGPAKEAVAPQEEAKAAKPGIVGAKLESETSVLRVHRKDGTRILELLPRQISDYNLDQVREQITAACKGERLVVLDLRNVNYVSSVVLGAFVNLHKELTQARITLRISSPTATVMDVLKVTRLNRLFSIHADLDAAIRARE